MRAGETVYIIFKDGNVHECHSTRDTAEDRMELFIYNDEEQAHTWSLTSYLIDS